MVGVVMWCGHIHVIIHAYEGCQLHILFDIDMSVIMNGSIVYSPNHPKIMFWMMTVTMDIKAFLIYSFALAFSSLKNVEYLTPFQ
jgi:hypothetical protein